MNTNTVKIPKGDFDSFVAKKGLEAFTKPQMDAWVTKNAELFTKATTNDFDEGESARFDEFKAELQSFTMIEVISKAENNAPLKHELMYVREVQVDWDETDDISKSEGDIEKARSGVYKDTQLNRKLGRVGQRFGGAGAKKEESGKIYSSDKFDAKNEREVSNSAVYPKGTKVIDVYDKDTDIYRATIPISRYKKEGSGNGGKSDASKDKVTYISSFKNNNDKLVKVGMKFTVPSNLTNDPIKMQGKSGIIQSINKKDNTITVKFSGGEVGHYDADIIN